MARSLSRRLLVGLSACVWVACKGGSYTREQAAQDLSASLRAAEVAGCNVVYAGPRCELQPERELRLWLPTRARVEARTDRGPLPMPAPENSANGARYQVSVPAEASYLELS